MPMDAEDDYVAAALARVPADATIKGMFINGLLDLAPGPLDGALGRRRIAFKDEPLRDFLAVAVAVARARFPALTLKEGLRALGRETYRVFLTSLTGRIVFGVLGKDIGKLIGATTKAYGLTQSHGRAVVVDSSAHHCTLAYQDLFQFLDALEVGVVEEAVASCGLQPHVEVKLDTPVSGTMTVTF